MEIPYTPIQYPQSNPFGGLADAIIAKRERDKLAAANLGHLSIEQQRLALERTRAGAEEARARAAEQRDISHGNAEKARLDREEKRATERSRTEKLGAILPLLDPNSPTFNPAMGQTLAKLHGVSLTQDAPHGPDLMPMEPQLEGSAPERPQPPAFIGPIDTPEHTRMLGLAAPTRLSGAIPGMIHQGNVDLTNRPDVANPDGTHSSVRSMSFGADGREVLVPTVSEDGRIMDDDEAMQQYDRTGRNLGQFTNPHAATAYAQRLHQQQESTGNAVAEVTRQQAERDKYAADLGTFRQRIQQHADEMDRYAQQRQEYQEQQKATQQSIAEQQAHPLFHLAMGEGEKPVDLDTRQVFAQSRGNRQERAKSASDAYAYDPQLARAAGSLATLGFPDEQIGTAIEKRFAPMSASDRAAQALAEKAREADQTDATRRAAIEARKKKGGTIGPNGISAKDEKLMLAETGKTRASLLGTARSPGLIRRVTEARALGDELREAFKSRDPNRINAALVSAKEKVTKLNTGGVPTQMTMHMVDELVGDPQRAGEKINSLLGQPEASHQRFDAVLSMIDQLDDSLVAQAKQANVDELEHYEGPAGVAKTPGRKRMAEGLLNELFSHTTDRFGHAIRGGSPAAAEPATNPLTAAAKASKLTGQDAEAVQWAQAHRGDARAEKILKLHGM